MIYAITRKTKEEYDKWIHIAGLSIAGILFFKYLPNAIAYMCYRGWLKCCCCPCAKRRVHPRVNNKNAAAAGDNNKNAAAAGNN